MSTLTHIDPPKKIRGDSMLASLPLEQQERLCQWLGDQNCTYSETVVRLLDTFGVRTSKSAVAMYYQRHLVPFLYDQETDVAAELAALPVGEFDAATLRRAKSLAYSALARPDPNIETASRLLDLVHRVQKQEIAQKRLALEERRVALRESLAAHPPAKPRAAHRRAHAPRPSSPPPTPRDPTPASPEPSPSPASTSPAPLPSSPTPASPPSPPPSSSQNSAPNPPLFPTSSSLNPPSAPRQPKPHIPYREIPRADWG